MSELGLEAMLERLKEIPSGMSIQSALRLIRGPEPTATLEARSRCALVRWFDRPIYDFLCAELEGRPDFGELTESAGVEQLAPEKWAIEAGERTRLLGAWQSDIVAWRAWNQKLGEYFAAHQGAEAQLSAVYHFAASTSPEAVEPLFRQWFAEADQRFDMAHCNGLLEMLRVQDSWRGPALSLLWRELREYHSARMLFVEEYFKTGSYFEREEVLSEFLSVLDRPTPDGPWIFHLHANGGLGKTMFTRWLIARYLVPRRIPCARVDFDDFKLDQIVNYPLQVIRRIVEQWSKQPKGGSLSYLLEKLQREEQNPGWNRSLMQEVNSQLRGSGIDSRIVVMLDTLEEVTLCAADWLTQCVSALRDIKTILPQLTLVLSGRYDIADRSHALVEGEYVNYDLPRFTEDEAQKYLESRSIPAGPVRDAIVARAAADDTVEGSANQLVGRNPFKLAMFAELALNRDKLTEADVLRFPRADIAYLIERVVKRIESQPLRWIIRYGALARNLTPQFAQAVLLPPLLTALRGTNSDQPTTGLSEYQDVWKPDPQAADDLERKGMSEVEGVSGGVSEGIADLWEKLSAYARERGWLSWVNSEDRTELRFHPEVINPTRDLLRHQEIFSELQQRSAEFFEGKALEMAERIPPENDASVRFSCEAVFHRFQTDGVGAESYWIDTLRRAEKLGPSVALPIATEITGREYAEAERYPYPRVSSLPLLLRAHCEAADLLLQADIADRKNWLEFRRHLELARSIAKKNPYLSRLIPPLLQTMYVAGLRNTAENKEVVEVLSEAMLFADDTRDQFFLSWQLGKFLVLQGAPEAAGYLRVALQLLRDAPRTSITFVDIHLKLVDLYDFQGVHTAVVESLRAARKSSTRSRNRARVLRREAGYFLKVGDVASAEKRLAEIKDLALSTGVSDPSADVLEARIAIVRLEPFAALEAATRPHGTTLSSRDRARALDQEGEACALLFEFQKALDRWNLAASSYDQARDPVGAARCGLLATALWAKVIGDFGIAETHVLSALSLRGSQDLEIQSELLLLHALVHLSKGRIKEAGELVSAQCARLDLPVRIRVRALVFALLFGFDSGEALLNDIEECLSEIQPLSLRDSVLDWAEYTDLIIVVPPEFVRRLMEQLARPSFESSSGAGLLIQRADLYRVFGMLKEAEAELARVADAGLLVGWRISSARDRLGLRAQYGALLERFLQSEFAETPLCSVLRVAAAWEAAVEEDFAAAQRALGSHPTNSSDLPVLWQGRLGFTLTQLVQFETGVGAPSPPELPMRPAAIPAPAAAAPIASQGVSIGENDIPVVWRPLATSTDLTVELFSVNVRSGWQGLAASLAAVLLDKNATDKALEITGSISALPWELGGAYYRRSSKTFSPVFAPVVPGPLGVVQLVVPAQGSSEISSDSDSGFSIEEIYRSYGIAPVTSFGFDPGPRPILMHIVAAVRESSSGIYLDFSASEYRAASFGLESTWSEISLTAFSLDQILATLPMPPFVILDLGLPTNRTEAVRMLLLRNLFATQLFELGHVRGILGCGLADSNDRWLLTSRYIESLLHGTVIEALAGLRSEIPRSPFILATDQEFDFALPRLAALWTNLPTDRLFIS